MEWLSVIGKWALVILAVANVAVIGYQNRKKGEFVWTICKRVRPLMVLESMVLVIAVMGSATIMILYVPFFNWGWTNLFFKSGGNILLSPMLEYSDSSGLWAKYVVLAFLLFFILTTPFLTKIEEEMFRKERYKWWDVTKQAVAFGLIHLTVGIPLGAAIALIGTGFFLGWKYRKSFIKHTRDGMYRYDAEDEAVLTSTTYHTVYNTIVVFILIFILFIR